LNKKKKEKVDSIYSYAMLNKVSHVLIYNGIIDVDAFFHPFL